MHAGLEGGAAGAASAAGRRLGRPRPPGQARRRRAAARRLAPTWLLRQPLPLGVQPDGQPCHHGPLRLLAGPHRIETGWWPDPATSRGGGLARPDAFAGTESGPVEQAGSPAAARDYYIAQNPAAELLWIYRERATAAGQGARATPRWFLQGLYA